MTHTMRTFKNEDYGRLRAFYKDTYAKLGPGYAWTVERVNFSHSLSRSMNATDLATWESQFGLWINNEGDIFSVVSSEGENKGEVHINRNSEVVSESLLNEWFEFIFEKLGKVEGNEKVWKLRIKEGDTLIEEKAAALGFSKMDAYEALSEVVIETAIETQLPEGLRVVTGDQVTDYEKSQAHALAFGYHARTELHERAEMGYALLRQEPDYSATTDCYLVNDANEIMAFCCIWMDQDNQLAILEPVGTVEKYQGQGYGKIIVEAAMNKAFAEGCKTFHVGADKGFYLAIGFKKCYEVPVWMKRKEV